MFRWEIDVLEYNHYGDKVVSRTPMSVLAENKVQVTDKVRTAFGATYDNFRKFWSHGWALKSVSEEPPQVPEADDAGRPEKPPMGIVSEGGI